VSGNIIRYLRFLYDCGGEASITDLAAKFDVKKSTVLDTVRKMVDSGLVVHPRYSKVKLTERGVKAAKEALWRHRVLETWLFSLGFTAEEACREAERIEAKVSIEVLKRLCSKFNHPSKCPCGKPIPRFEGCCPKR